MHRLFLVVTGLLALYAPPAAAESLTLGTTANPAPAAIFLADQQGLFKKHGLDLAVQIITGDPTIPAALVSNSIQLASVTPTTFLNAVINGIDLVALTGTTITTKESRDVVIVASKASGIADAKGFAGKTVAVPGIGAVLDVMLKSWLTQKGVDVATIKFIEIPLPAQADQLKAGRIDALITVNQFAQPMLGGGFGTLISYALADLPEGQTAQEIVATRAWAEANPKAVAALRAALKEAEEMGKADSGKIRAALGAAMKLPPPVVEKIALPSIDISLKPEQLGWWLEEMKKQGLVKTDIDVTKLILQ